MTPKRLIATAITCVAVLGAAGPAQAEQDDGRGTTQRCAAAQNGQHNGFTCEDVVDDSARACPRGYTLVLMSYVQDVDMNENGVVCARR